MSQKLKDKGTLQRSWKQRLLLALAIIFFNTSGRVPPLHRGAVAPREDLRVHVVQPAGRQAEVLQEAREADVARGREAMQGGAHGNILDIQYFLCFIYSINLKVWMIFFHQRVYLFTIIKEYLLNTNNALFFSEFSWVKHFVCAALRSFFATIFSIIYYIPIYQKVQTFY
jgi:hypothetical protein